MHLQKLAALLAVAIITFYMGYYYRIFNAPTNVTTSVRYTTCPINAANATVTSDQVLIAMVNPLDNANAGMTAKCIIEYTN